MSVICILDDQRCINISPHKELYKLIHNNNYYGAFLYVLYEPSSVTILDNNYIDIVTYVELFDMIDDNVIASKLILPFLYRLGDVYVIAYLLALKDPYPLLGYNYCIDEFLSTRNKYKQDMKNIPDPNGYLTVYYDAAICYCFNSKYVSLKSKSPLILDIMNMLPPFRDNYNIELLQCSNIIDKNVYNLSEIHVNRIVRSMNNYTNDRTHLKDERLIAYMLIIYENTSEFVKINIKCFR